MRIAITGASGNVGTALLKALADDPHTRDHSVVGLSRRQPPDAGIDWRTVDLAEETSSETLRETFADADAVVHLAVAFQPMRDRGYLRRVNVGGTRRVAEACAAAGVGHLVHMSSSGIYAAGAYGRRVDETFSRAGVASSTYSMDKAAEEDVLDAFEAENPEVAVARVRPGMIGQYAFGSAVLRYALPDIIPSSVVNYVPLLPIDPKFVIPAVHSDDVADAVKRILERNATGAFNLAADEPARAGDVADALGARQVPVPYRALTAAVRAGFSTHLLPIHHGWVDLAFNTPLLDTTRAREILQWQATVDGPQVLRETVAGMRSQASGPSAPLRERSTIDRLTSFARRGFLSRGKRP